ncbi:MAG: hypothetical protein ACHRHE_17610 [Tepidisphaerales bacterium]
MADMIDEEGINVKITALGGGGVEDNWEASAQSPKDFSSHRLPLAKISPMVVAMSHV